jgi:hypothetical protein
VRSIFFNVRPDVGQDSQETLLKRLTGLTGVQKAAALRPNSKNAAVRRMYYAQVNDDADIESLREAIASSPEVESADLPAQRGLMNT